MPNLSICPFQSQPLFNLWKNLPWSSFPSPQYSFPVGEGFSTQLGVSKKQENEVPHKVLCITNRILNPGELTSYLMLYRDLAEC